MANPSVDTALNAVFASMRLSSYGIALLALCVFVAMAEGYDVITMALAAPMVASAWSIAPSQIGILLAGSVIGMVAGSFLLAPLGDRLGRRPSILMGLSIACLGTSGGAFAPDYAVLLITRLIAGLGLGFAMSNVLAIAMEVVPARLRTLAVVIVACGYPLGAGFGGAISSQFTETHGHAAMFLFGGGGTLTAILLCAAFLPESPMFLARDPRNHPKLRKLLERLGGHFAPGALENLAPDASQTDRKRGLGVAALFTPDRRMATLLLWLVSFSSGCTVYFFMTWLPSLFVGRGLSPQLAIAGTSLFNGAGVIGGLLLAVMLRPVGPTRVLGGCFVVAIVATLCLAWFDKVDALYWVMIGLSGAMVVGSQFCLMAVVNQFYPSDIRVTGAAYSSGAARLGAIFAPLAGGVVVEMVSLPQYVFVVATVPALLALIGIIALHGSASFRTPAAT